MARVQIVHQEYYVDGNPIDRSNQNLILDMPLYQVEFLGVEIQELATKVGKNIISKSMYAWYNVHEYVLLESFVNNRKNVSVLSVEDQKVVIKGAICK